MFCNTNFIDSFDCRLKILCYMRVSFVRQYEAFNWFLWGYYKRLLMEKIFALGLKRESPGLYGAVVKS